MIKCANFRNSLLLYTSYMKKFTLIISFLIFNDVIRAQDKLPSFGKIDKVDLEIKDCDFDPGAEAFVLIDLSSIEFNYFPNIGWVSETNYRVRIKVLKEKAVNRAQIKLKFRSENRREEITNVKGVSFNLGTNGNIEESELEKRSVYEKEINKEFTEISFAMPNVRIGSVFEYRYKLIRKSYSYIPSWNFQQRIPVRYSAYNVIVPEYFQFTVLSTLRQNMEKGNENSGEKGSWYMMHNIKGLKDEPFSSGREDYLQRIEFQLSSINAPGYFPESIRTTWPKIIDELVEAEEFGSALKKNIKGTADLDVQLAYNISAKEKTRLIYNYVQRNMQWNQEYGIITYDGIKSAWDKKNGTLTEINFILISLLKDAGIKAKPLLISTKDNGKINTFYPFLNQFNGVMVYVKDGDDIYIMNAADKFNPFNLVPYDVAFTNALVVDKNGGGIIELSCDGKFRHDIFFTCSVEPDGKITGQTNIKSAGYARNVRLEAHQKKRIKEILEDNSGINIKVDSVTVINESNDTLPLEQRADFSGSIQTGGDYSFLPFNLFMGLGKNLFIDDDRVMDIDFYYPQTYVVNGTYYLPDDFMVSELPKNTKMIMPDTGIILSRRMQIDGNIISFRLLIEVKVFGYAADTYPYIKEFYKKMYAIMDEKIVLKKK